MKLASFIKDGKSTYGAVDNDRVIDLGAKLGSRFPDLKSLIANGGFKDAASSPATAAESIPLKSVEYLPVIPNPAKIFCIGINYADHQKETGRSALEYPTVFLRFTDTLLGAERAAWVPRISTMVDYECELAVVIGKAGRHIDKAKAFDHVAGYTCFNDISIRDWQRHTSQFTPGKNFPRTGALGPWMVTKDEVKDPHALAIRTRLNGQVLQDANTSQLIFKIPELIAYLSGFTEIAPGDVIATGTPSGVGFVRNPPIFMKAGDIVEVEIDDIGVLRNRMEPEPA